MGKMHRKKCTSTGYLPNMLAALSPELFGKRTIAEGPKVIKVLSSFSEPGGPGKPVDLQGDVHAQVTLIQCIGMDILFLELLQQVAYNEVDNYISLT